MQLQLRMRCVLLKVTTTIFKDEDSQSKRG